MAEIIRLDNNEPIDTEKTEITGAECDLVEITEGILFDARAAAPDQKSWSMPIAQLSTLGAGAASLLPAFRTITQTTAVGKKGLYRLANKSTGDVLKKAKDGNFWAAFKKESGGSKMVKLKEAEPLSQTTKTVMPIDPATMMMAVALFSIEQQLGKIEQMGRQILTFLEVEKEAEIEADVETLIKIISNYKLNWDNEHFVASNHKLVCDIQRTARKNINAYQKKVTDILESKQLFALQARIRSTLSELQKKCRYYRLSLYTFSMASFVEIMLSGNFKEDYILGVKDEIERMSFAYREIFDKCSVHLEKMGNVSVEANLLKGIGIASNALGKLIGKIPVVKDGQADEFLQNSGSHIKESAFDSEKQMVESFAEVGNPGTRVFLDKMDDMIQIYNHTSNICFDSRNIYLIAG